MKLYGKEYNTVAESISINLDRLIENLNKAKEKHLTAQGLTNLVDRGYNNFHINKVGQKFLYLDAGGSGCFLVEIATGELYNIKGYGVPDYNKKKKADIGNVATVDASWLYSKRWNYLR